MLREMTQKLVYLTGILDSSPNIITVLDPRGRILLYSKSGEQQLGFRKRDLVGRRLSVLLKKDRPARELMKLVDTDGHVDEFQVTAITRKGYEIPYSVGVRQLHDEDGAMLGYVVNMHDIHRRIKLEKQQRRQYAELDSIVSNSGAMIVTTNARGKITKINPAAERALGVRQEDMIGKTMIDFYADKKLRRSMLQKVKDSDVVEFEADIFVAGGEVRTFHVVLSNMRSPKSGKFLGTVGISYDITKRKEAESRLREMLVTDPLTGLGNRRFFFSRIQGLISDGIGKKPVTLAFVDFDGFKTYNDTFGHQAGDELLAGFAALCDRTKVGQRPIEFFRYGGDEFVCLIESVARDRVAKALDNLRKRFATKHKRLVTLSIGLTRYQAGDTVESMINRADEAVYAAKDRGRNCLMICDKPESIVSWPSKSRSAADTPPADSKKKSTETRSRQKR